MRIKIKNSGSDTISIFDLWATIFLGGATEVVNSQELACMLFQSTIIGMQSFRLTGQVFIEHFSVNLGDIGVTRGGYVLGLRNRHARFTKLNKHLRYLNEYAYVYLLN
jgi:hypothetical protein